MTQVTSAQANKILQAALFTAANRSHSLVNMLTEEAPKGAKVNGGKQTSAGAPVAFVGARHVLSFRWCSPWVARGLGATGAAH